MVQRIQSIYLLLGAAALAIPLFFDVLWESTAARSYVWFEPVYVGLSLLAAAIAVGAIFLYRMRRRQRSAVVAAQTVTVLALIALYGALFMTGGMDVRVAGDIAEYKVAMLGLPVAAYVLFFLGRRGIEHDIELVESMDRLR